MSKKVVKIKMADLRKAILGDTIEPIEEKVIETFPIELTAEEIDMLKRLLEMVDGEDEQESAVLASAIEKLNCEQSKEDND